MTVELDITQVECNIIYEFTTKMQVLVNDIAFRPSELIKLNADFTPLANDWQQILNKHSGNENSYYIMKLLMALMNIKTAEDYNVTGNLVIKISDRHIKSLKAIVYDMSNWANDYIIQISQFKKQYEEEMDELKGTIQSISDRYQIRIDDKTHDIFSYKPLWLRIYEICQYIHNNYIDFPMNIKRISEYLNK